MNWGILSLLGIIVAVLGGVGAFFIFLIRRASRFAENLAASEGLEAAASVSLDEERPYQGRAGEVRGELHTPVLWRLRRACSRRPRRRPEAQSSRP